MISYSCQGLPSSVTSVPLLVQRTKNGIRVKISCMEDGKREKAVSLLFFPIVPGELSFFASAPRFPLAHTGLFSGEGLELSSILRDMNDWRLTLP